MSSPPGAFLGAVTHRASAPGWTITDLKHPRPNRFPMHAHRWSCLTVLLGGEYAECIEGRWQERAVNSLIIRPAQAPHSDRVGSAGARFLNVEVSAELLPERSDLARPLAEWLVVRSPAIVSVAWRLLGELHRGERADLEVMDGYITTLLAELTVDPETTRNPPAWLGRALEMIHEGFAGSVSITALAGECGVHPAHFTRVFRRQLGQTVGSYLRGLRLSSAMRRLADPQAAPARVSHDAGFHDQSHLSRTLRAVTGLTPGQYRRLAAAELS